MHISYYAYWCLVVTVVTMVLYVAPVMAVDTLVTLITVIDASTDVTASCYRRQTCDCCYYGYKPENGYS